MPAILAHLRYNVNDVEAIVSASRTATPHTAKDILKLLHIKIPDGDKHQLVSSSDLFDHKTWGQGSKIKHFKEIQKVTGVDYHDMLFFDDEYRNIDVQEKLGVTFVYLDERYGLTWEAYRNGLNLWRERRSK